MKQTRNAKEEIKWEEIIKCWNRQAKQYEPQLLKPLPFEKIHVNYLHQNDYFFGADWIEKTKYEERIRYVTTNTTQFLLYGHCLNKGTLHTLELLIEAGDRAEDCAAIWIAAFAKDMEEQLPTHWRGNGYSILDDVYREAERKVYETYSLWHHAMKRLLPEICFSWMLLEGINITSYEQIVELAVINAAQVYNNYRAVIYDSREEPVKEIETES